MTNDALKASALEAVEEISKGNPNYSNSRPSEIEWTAGVFIRRLQPLVDADRQETERLKKALEAFQLWDQLTYRCNLVKITEKQINDAYQKAVDLMRQVFGEEK